MLIKCNRNVFFRPWESKKWESIFKSSELRLDKERVYTLSQLLKRSLRFDGNVVEMGVYKGCSAYCIAAQMSFSLGGRNSADKRLILCDTFEGTPAIYDKEKGDINRKGKYADTSVDYVEEKVKKVYGNVEMVQGFIPNSLEKICDNRFCFAHLHLNLYQSTKDALIWLNNRMTDNGMIVIEDYGIDNCEGVRRSVDEYVSENERELIYLPTGQAVIEFL